MDIIAFINTTISQLQTLELRTLLPLVLLTCLGILLTILAIKRLARGKLLTASAQSLSGIIILASAVLLFGIALNIHTYQRLTYEMEVAQLNFQELAPKQYKVSITVSENNTHQELILDGDEWQLDARILKWSPGAQLLGLNAQYRLERISGRYQDLDLEQTMQHTVHSLSQTTGLDIWSLARKYKNWLPWIDAYYGSAVYLPMIDGGSYSVAINQSGLIARPSNDTAEQSVRSWQ